MQPYTPQDLDVDIDEIDPTDFVEKFKTDPNSLVMLDVRSPGEFRVSRLKGAYRMDPEARAADVSAILAGELKGKDLVGYCTGAARSLVFLDKHKELFLGLGANSVKSLRVGIAALQHYGLELESDLGKTEVIHPYNSKWSALFPDSKGIDLLRSPAAVVDFIEHKIHSAYHAQRDWPARMKADGTVVSELDEHLQTLTEEFISEFSPDTTFVGEESIGSSRSGWFFDWDCDLATLDPLDGTSRWLNGESLYSYSLGVGKGTRESVSFHAGYIYLPPEKQVLYLSEGGVFLSTFGEEPGQGPLEFKRMERALSQSPNVFVSPQLARSHRLYPERVGYPGSYYSSVRELIQVALGQARAAVTDARLWDIAGVLPFLHATDCGLFSLVSGEELVDLPRSAFHESANPAHYWRLKEPLLAAARDDVESVLQLLK